MNRASSPKVARCQSQSTGAAQAHSNLHYWAQQPKGCSTTTHCAWEQTKYHGTLKRQTWLVKSSCHTLMGYWSLWPCWPFHGLNVAQPHRKNRLAKPRRICGRQGKVFSTLPARWTIRPHNPLMVNSRSLSLLVASLQAGLIAIGCKYRHVLQHAATIRNSQDQPIKWRPGAIDLAYFL